MAEEVFTLSSNTFPSNCPATFRQLWDEKVFTDVTLATEDDGQIMAHKIILSSCSPFFKHLLERNPHPTPLLYLKGVQLAQLKAVLQYVYRGECKVRQGDIPGFLATGRDLLVEGLLEEMDNTQPQKQEPFVSDLSNDPATNRKTQHNNKSPSDIITHSGADIGVFQDSLEEILMHKCKQCSYKSSQTSNMKQHILQQHEGVRYICDECDYKATDKSNLNRHVKKQHEGVTYSCSECDYKSFRKDMLKCHTQSAHEGVTYDCHQCDSKFKNKSHLKIHIQSVHELFMYGCDQCDYQGARIGSLKLHKESKHEGVRYNCDQCDDTFTFTHLLKKHKSSVHDGVRYNCDQCGKQYARRDGLTTHLKENHHVSAITSSLS
jgi:hypothetical protein